MSSQLFFRDKGKFWTYTEITKGAGSNCPSMSLLNLEAKRICSIRVMRLVKTQTAMLHTKNADAMFIILGGKALEKRLEKVQPAILSFCQNSLGGNPEAYL